MKILIIGQGLAGSVLAHRLFFDFNNPQLTIVDTLQTNASQISSGIMNPVTGRRIVKTWECENLFEDAEKFYRQAGKNLGQDLIEKQEIIRFFESTKEYNDFILKSGEKIYQKYLKEEPNPPEAQFINNNFGSGKIEGAFVVNAIDFLKKTQLFFTQNNCLKEEKLQFDENFVVNNKGVFWQNQHFDCAIFAEGYQAIKNPYFGSLPFYPAKGEVFIATIPQLPQNRLIKKGIFFVPLGKQQFWVGATHLNHDLNLQASEKGLAILQEKIENALNFSTNKTPENANKTPTTSHTIDRIEVGIRPATKDRRPFVGKHPKHDNLFIFNGFGTKGISLTPWAATQLCQFILHQKPLHEEIDVARFF